MALRAHLDETLEWELQAITDAFDRRAEELEKQLNWTGISRVSTSVTEARGLSGGGLR